MCISQGIKKVCHICSEGSFRSEQTVIGVGFGSAWVIVVVPK